MPGRDKTGPNGQGMMTGRGFGHCGGNNSNANNDSFTTRGLGFGRGARNGRGYGNAYGMRRGNGMGRGFGYGYQQSEAYDTEKKELEDRISDLENKLSELLSNQNSQNENNKTE